jgi:hypothetical protein
MKISGDLNRYFTLSQKSFRSYIQEQRTQQLVRDWNNLETNLVSMVTLARDQKDISEVKLMRNDQIISARGSSVTIQNGTTQNYNINILGGRLVWLNSTNVNPEQLENSNIFGWRYVSHNGTTFVRYSVPQWWNHDIGVRGSGNPFVVHSMHLIPLLENIVKATKPTEQTVVVFLSPNMTNLASNQNFPVQDIRLSTNSFLSAVSEYIAKVMILETEVALLTTYITRIHTVKLGDESMGYLIVGIPFSDSFEEFRLANTRAAIFGTCFTLIALGLVGCLGWCIVRPIHEMRQEMIRFSKADIKKVERPKLMFCRFTEILRTQIAYEMMIQSVAEKVQEIYFPASDTEYYYVIRPSALTSKPKFCKGDDSINLDHLEVYPEPNGNVSASFFGIGRKQPRSLRSLSKFSTHSTDSFDSEESDSIDSSLVNGICFTGPNARTHTKHHEAAISSRAQFFGTEGRIRRHSTRIAALFPKLRSDKITGSHSVIVLEEIDIDRSKFTTSKNQFKSLETLPKKSQQNSFDELKKSGEVQTSSSVDNISRGSASARSSISKKPDLNMISERVTPSLQPTSLGHSLLIPSFQRRRESAMTTSTQETSQASQDGLGLKARPQMKEEDPKVAQSRETIETNCSDRSEFDESLILIAGSSLLFPPIREEPGTEALEPHIEIDERESMDPPIPESKSKENLNQSQL